MIIGQPVPLILPTIRRSLGRIFSLNFTDDQISVFCRTLPTIRRSISVFLPNVTDDPTIKCWIFCRKLPMIRRSTYGFFAKSYRRSDDQLSGFFANSCLWSLTFRFLNAFFLKRFPYNQLNMIVSRLIISHTQWAVSPSRFLLISHTHPRPLPLTK